MGEMKTSIGILATLVLICISASANAAFTYTETWSDADNELYDAVNNGDSLIDFPEWSYIELASEAANARAGGGQLILAGTGTQIGAVITPGDVGLAGSAFDVSTTPLVISTSVGSQSGGAGAFSAGVVVGDVAFILHPGLGGGAHRVQTFDVSTIYQNNTDMGFTPGTAVFTDITISVVETGTDYEFTYSIGSYDNVILIPILDAGPIEQIGLYESGVGDGNFGAFTASQVPTPAALPAGLAMLGLVATRRRREH